MLQAKTPASELDLGADPKLPDDVVLAIFTTLVRISSFASATRSKIDSGEGPAPKTITRGDEAALAGALAGVRADDALFPSEVDASVALARGATMSEVAAQRVAWKKLKVAPPSWHNGAHMTHAAGFAWGAKIAHDDVAAIAFSPENVLETGEVHNALNFAGVFKLPVIFLVRASAAASAELRGRAQEYGITVVLADGGDPMAICKAVRDARARAAGGGGATLIGALVDPDEKRDAVLLLRRHLESTKAATHGQLEKIVADAASEVAASVDISSSRAQPSIIENVFAAPPWHLREQLQSSGK